MNIANKLRIAFALYITLLTLLLVYHVTTLQRVVQTGEELIEISSRVRATSIEQVTRITQISENAAKFWVTRDKGYLEKYSQLVSDYSSELERLDSLQLSPLEREEFSKLRMSWDNIGDPIQRLTSPAPSSSSTALTALSLSSLQDGLDSVLFYTQNVGEASQEVMSMQLEGSAAKAAAAERLSWISGFGVLILSIILSALLTRAISDPLKKLTIGTREVAAGQFDYRLNITGNDEFAQVATDFNVMTAKLGELDQMKRDFVSQVSHDLKTPLSSMQETISLLLDQVLGPLNSQQAHLLELHQQSAERLSSMLAKLLDLSKIESGVKGDIQLIEVQKLLDRAVDQVIGSVREQGLIVNKNFEDESVLLECDGDRILQVIDNLLENAIKFSPRGGTIELGMKVYGERPQSIPPSKWRNASRSNGDTKHILLWVSDEGPGVPNAQKSQVFTRFFQGESGRSTQNRGVGLGLTICREITLAHGGDIWVSDNSPSGSIFQVLLPGALSIPAGAMAGFTDHKMTT